MKLAEALQERSDLNTKISELKGRLENNALVQEGEEPAEDPAALLKELDAATARLTYLISCINKTNCRTVADGKTLTDIIAQKDILSVKVNILRNLISAASRRTNRYAQTEIKILSTVNVRDLQKQADDISAEIRKLDNLLQASNWSTDLIENG